MVSVVLWWLSCGCGEFRREYKDGGDSPYNFRCDKDYYNDMPGKVPPDLLCNDNDGAAAGAQGGVGTSTRGVAPSHLNIRVSEIG